MQTYLILSNHFSGKFHDRLIPELAELIGTSKQNARKRIKRLLELGMLEETRNGHYNILGKRRFNVTDGRLSNKMMSVSEKVLFDIKKLRNAAYAIELKKATNYAASRKRKSQREDSDPPREVSATYYAKWMRDFASNSNGNCSTSTARKHRALAHKNGFIILKRSQKDHGRFRRREEAADFCPAIRGFSVRPKFDVDADINFWHIMEDKTSRVTPLFDFTYKRYKYSQQELQQIRFLLSYSHT